MKKTFAFFCLSLFLINDAFAANPHSEGYKEVKGLPQLDPSSYASQTFWLLIAFSFLYFVLSRSSLPVISRTINNRSEHIKNDLEAAERIRVEVTSVQEAYEGSLKEARSSAIDMANGVNVEIKEKSDQYAHDFQKKSEESIVSLEKDIDNALSVAMENIGAVATDIAIEAAEKIVGTTVDRKKAESIMLSVHI